MGAVAMVMPGTVKAVCIGWLLILLARGNAVAIEVGHHGFSVESEGRYGHCATCHDGIIAPPVSSCLETICFYNDSHPINNPYPPVNRLEEFRPTAVAEQAGIRFTNGRLDCISCHNLLNLVRFHLRVETRKNRLCLACHRK